MDGQDIVNQFATWNHLNRTIIGGDMNGYSQNVHQTCIVPRQERVNKNRVRVLYVDSRYSFRGYLPGGTHQGGQPT